MSSLSWTKSPLWRWWPVPVVVALAFIPLSVNDWTLGLLSKVFALGILAISVMILTGYAGLPTLGQIAPYAVGAYLTYQLAESGFTVGPLQLLIAAAAGAVFNAVVGLAVTRTRGPAFLMVTLAVCGLTEEVARQWSSVTGGSDGTSRIPAPELWWGTGPIVDDWHAYWYCLAIVILVAVGTAAVLRATPGTLIRGFRDDEIRMRASGHRVSVYLMVAYTGAGALAGLAGSLLATNQRYLAPTDVDLSVAALVLLAVTIGGTTSIVGALGGVAIAVLVRDQLVAELGGSGEGPLVLGLVFIVCVYALPNGLSGLRLKRIRRRFPLATRKENA
ncbi:MAG: branched-chain amino acid ABC transporter permease [Stackebrandtia sp.]